MNRQDLPADFNCDNYRKLHHDLASFSDESLISHYLMHGIYEGRAYKMLLSDFVFGPPKKGGVNVLGFINNILGLGATCRMVVESLQNSGIPVHLNQFPLERITHRFLETTDECRYGVNIVCMNPDIRYDLIDPRYFKDKVNVALVFWELEMLPDTWIEALQPFDEIWVSSTFNEEIMRRHFPGKEVCFIPMKPEDTEKMDQAECKARLGIDENTFLCAFIFDFRSDFYRKNPEAVIKAFQTAFPSGEDCKLIIKTHHCPEMAFNYLKQQVNKDSRIIIWNEEIPKEGQNTLMNACDLYISLHRSEGLGLTMMEALLLGKPVVCTNYSGNLDFCSEDSVEFVNYSMVGVHPNSYYATFAAPNSIWADPDVREAAQKIRKVYENYDLSLQKADLGKKWIEEKYNPLILNEKIAGRIEELLLKGNK